MASSKPLIYAELLSNIRQISVIAALDTPCNSATKVELSDNGCQIILFHHGESHILALPGQANPNTQLQKPVLGSKELSWRLPLAAHAKFPSQEDAQSCDAPWSARVLGGNEKFACKHCGAVILKRGCIKIWKDLPSENWAEMMDFWHCHKPDVKEEEGIDSSDHSHGPQKESENALTERGYGANSKFAAQPGVGFVDLTTFLVSENDCTNITLTDNKQSSNGQATSFSLLATDIATSLSLLPNTAAASSLSSTDIGDSLSSPPTNVTNNKISQTSLCCARCSTNLGHLDSGCRLMKWLLRCSSSSFTSSDSAAAPPSTILSEPSSTSFSTYFPPLALALLREQLSSKILLLPQLPSLSPISTSPISLFLWLFSPGFRCSSTAWPRSAAGVPVMKLFWKVVGEDAVNTLRDKLGVEELVQPAEAVVDLERALRESALFLPPSSRKFQEWNVGLLEKFKER